MTSLSATSVALLLAVHVAAQGPSAPAQPESSIDFGRDVRPILSDNCFACHGFDVKKRKGGLRLDTSAGARSALPSGARAVVPGRADQSELLRRVGHPDSGERMPPRSTGKQLTDEQIAILTAWIEEGADYQVHWAFVPPVAPAVPEVRAPDGLRNPIDTFVCARLESEGLHPSPEADRDTLIRRVTYDLTGLPPTLAEVDAFCADDRPGAYERVVDRLLDSPRYGEHMARYWLDAARYADTHGFHIDNRRSLWPWRDWVIAAFNANMPFDQFTVEQLAGDLLPDATVEQQIATGFNRCNPTTGEGGLIEEEYLVKYAIDRVETTGTVWMGLTVGCAQCHDHKFDPISQREFYELFAFFNNIDEEGTDRNAEVPPPSVGAPTAEQLVALEASAAEIAGIEAELDAPMPELDGQQAEWEIESAAELDGAWTELAPASALSSAGATMRILDDRSVLVSGFSPEHDIYEVVARTDVVGVTAIRLEGLTHESQLNGGVGRASHSNIVLTGFEVEAAPADRPLDPTPVPLVAATADYSQPKYGVRGALDGSKPNGWAISRGREDRVAVFAPAQPFGAEGGTLLRLRLRFESNHGQHTIGRFRLSVSTDRSAAPATLSDWHVVGPFEAVSGEVGFEAEWGPEAHGDRWATYEGVNGQTWRRRSDFVDDAVHQLGETVGVTYLQRTIHAPSARPMTLGIGSDDAIVVWLNDERVFANNVKRGVDRDQEVLTLQLREGTNKIRLKIVNYGGPAAFAFRVIGEETQSLPTAVVRAVCTTDVERSPAQRKLLRHHFRRQHSPVWQQTESRLLALRQARQQQLEAVPRTMVMKERAERRPAHVLIRGRYDRKADPVSPGVPSMLPPLRVAGEPSRLDFARWLVDPEHPLTARVAVNRLWQQLFGTGIVRTAENFGAQGEWPSHPALLDWLAVRFLADGWNIKAMLRLMVTSATYRQSSAVTPEAWARDRDNRLLARGPRFRLDGEVIRDTALAVSGLLVDQVGGPSVRPYQPTGIWRAVSYPTSNTAQFEADPGEGLYRRSLYTFWKRTAPPPTLSLFDAPSREACTVVRARTNTPLQALALMNDVQFVEAARGLAVRVVEAGGDTDDERIAYAFRLATGRRPDAEEVAILREVFEAQLAEYRADPAAARALLEVGASKWAGEGDAIVVAAWAALASVILNLDETVTKT